MSEERSNLYVDFNERNILNTILF